MRHKNKYGTFRACRSLEITIDYYQEKTLGSDVFSPGGGLWTAVDMEGKCVVVSNSLDELETEVEARINDIASTLSREEAKAKGVYRT